MSYEIEPNKEAAEKWLRQFLSEESAWTRLSMLGDVALRLGSNLVELGVQQVGELAESAQKAFLETTQEDAIEDAKIIEPISEFSDESHECYESEDGNRSEQP